MPAPTITFPNRILYLCEDPDALKQQLEGTPLDTIPADLCDNISTDEITPGWVCFWYDQTLGRYSLVGLRNQAIAADDLRQGNFSVLVAGKSKGCGSSRETAPYSQKAAGVQLILARSFEKIYKQNCQNIGLLVSTDFSLIERIQEGEAIDMAAFTQGLDPIAQAIVEHGGLFAYNKARLGGHTHPALPQPGPRPMTAVEKIIAAHTIRNAREQLIGVDYLEPDNAVFCRTDVRFSHEYVTPMAASLFFEGFGATAQVLNPESVYAFRDHLTFLGDVMPEAQRQKGLLNLADDLATVQEKFCAQQGIKLYGPHPEGGSDAICHNAVLEDIALPGQLIAGTDSHTCTAGALGSFAFGVGSTDMANAWFTGDVRVHVPHTLHIQLEGQLPRGTCAKDVMLALMAQPYFKEGKAIGQVLEFSGEPLADLNMDERATLTNMAVEAGATTGFIAADAQTLAYLEEERGIAAAELTPRIVRSDADAHYAHSLTLNLSNLSPMVATPGDPRNGIPISSLETPVTIDIAYGGSCTGGKKSDMLMYGEVLRQALQQGKKVHPNVALYIQFGSQKIKSFAQEQGLIEVFEQAGATLLNPSCGACIKAGPGVSEKSEQVTVSAINRNFPGRSGPGKVYLASPPVVAASAIAGTITTPEALLG